MTRPLHRFVEVPFCDSGFPVAFGDLRELRGDGVATTFSCGLARNSVSAHGDIVAVRMVSETAALAQGAKIYAKKAEREAKPIVQ